MKDHVGHNRAFWDGDADDYQAAHGDGLTRRPLAWGGFRAPEAELHALGDTAGRDVLELGCGAAQWSIALLATGARCIGLDLSQSQLRHARKHAPELPLVNANGEQLPFADASFDIVFCDHGALSFCDPEVIVPEAARVLRPGGTLTFCASTPLLYLTWNHEKEKQSRRLHQDYDQLGRLGFEDGTIDWTLPPGEWIRVLRANGLEIEALIELRPPADATTTYDFIPLEWAQKWPGEWIWKTRRAVR